MVLLLGSILVIVVATTMPWGWYYVGHSHWDRVEWLPFSRTVRPLDFVLNVLLFVPFGLSATVAVARDAQERRPWQVMLAAIALSLAVELFQVFCHGRQPTMTDVLSNTLGAWLGYRITSLIFAPL